MGLDQPLGRALSRATNLDTRAKARKIDKQGSEPRAHMRLKIVSFDEANGELWAEVKQV